MNNSKILLVVVTTIVIDGGNWYINLDMSTVISTRSLHEVINTSLNNMNRNAVLSESSTTLMVHILIDGKEILPQAL